MKISNQILKGASLTAILFSLSAFDAVSQSGSKVPHFSAADMDTSVSPGKDFYKYADGKWLENNPVPADKSRWGSFNELQEHNWFLLHEILEGAAQDRKATANSPTRKVGDFFASAMDTTQLEKLGITPLKVTFGRINALKSRKALMGLIADLHERGVGSLFGEFVNADLKNSSVYAFYLSQGGLSLPDRDYYLTDAFAKQRTAYVAHVAKMLTLAGYTETESQNGAKTILEIETALAKACKSRVDLRDPIANYHKFTVSEVESKFPNLEFPAYFKATGVGSLQELVVRQPEFFSALDQLLKERPLGDWQVYLRWHALHATAPYLSEAFEKENFAFYGTVLSDQPVQEPRWQRAAKVIDGSIGEALGQVFVEKHFTATAKARMTDMIGNIKAVFQDRLKTVDWITEETRAKALAKFERFTQKIGHPDKFRDYSSVMISKTDYLGNVQRAMIFESRRELARLGKPIDKTEWNMTPPTVNAYFNQSQNEIVFPAGILQPPFFDVEMDDAINYGAIGVVIGHEITHGFDDQGRKYDADGNLKDWWTEADGKAFVARSQKVVDQFNDYEALPGLHVNGKLTLGENLADLGGTSIAYEALQRALKKDPSKRKPIDGFTPEQRFFLSLSQLWKTNWREAELRNRVTTDPHSPGQFRAIGAHVNMQEFYDAFGIKEGDPMWRKPELRAKVW